jgi:hypothetical protein
LTQMLLVSSQSHQASMVVNKSCSGQVNSIRSLITIVILEAVDRGESVSSPPGALARLQVKASVVLSSHIRIKVAMRGVRAPDRRWVLQIVLHLYNLLLDLSLEVLSRSYGLVIGELTLRYMVLRVDLHIFLVDLIDLVD